LNLRIPVVRGVIARRLLVNFRVKAEIVERLLPPPFRPKLVCDWAMAGICLIRLERLRPAANQGRKAGRRRLCTFFEMP
jgi:hypothetical protein